MNDATLDSLNQAITLMQAKNYEPAVQLLQELIKDDPKNPEFYRHLGNAYACLDRYDDGIQAFKTALMYKKEDGQLLYSLGGLYLLKDQIKEGIQYYNRAEAAGYRTVRLYTSMAGVFAENHDYPQAIRSISRAIELMPLRGDLYIRKAYMQIQFGMPDEALLTLEDLNSVIPDAAESYTLRMQIYLDRKDWSAAEKIVQDALDRFPADPAMWLLKLQLLVETKQYSEALPWAQKILVSHAEPEIRHQALMYQVTVLGLQNQPDALIQALESYPEINQDDQAIYMLMNVYQLRRNMEKVLFWAGKLEKATDQPELLAAAEFYRVNALHQLRGMEAAAPEYKRILPLLRRYSLESPQNREIYVYRLLCHSALEQYDKALKLCSYLCNAYPEFPDGYLYQSFVFEKMGDQAKADKARQAAKSISPDLKIHI